MKRTLLFEFVVVVVVVATAIETTTNVYQGLLVRGPKEAAMPKSKL